MTACWTSFLERPFSRRCLPLVLAVLALLAAVRPADAKVMVLSFQGHDAAKIQSAVSSALVSSGQDVTPGDTSFEDAAVLIGCDAQSDACAEEVLNTLSVDEVVFGSSSKNGEVVLQRAVRGQPRRQARVRVEPGQGLEAAISPAVRELYGQPRPVSEQPRPVSEQPRPVSEQPHQPEPPPASPLPEASASESTVAADRPYRRWALISGGAAGAAVLAGMFLWINASSLQDDIDRAPDQTQADLDALRDLESRAERSSNWGNAMMVVGVGLASVGTYLWIKDRRQHRTPVPAVQPTLFPGGAGVLVTIGGNR